MKHRILVFVAMRSEGREAVELYQGQGRRVVHISSASDNDERARAIKWFKETEEAVLVANWRLISLGWRIDAEAIVIFSPTFPNDPADPAPMLQCLARVTKPLYEDGTPIRPQEMQWN